MEQSFHWKFWSGAVSKVVVSSACVFYWAQCSAALAQGIRVYTTIRSLSKSDHSEAKTPVVKEILDLKDESKPTRLSADWMAWCKHIDNLLTLGVLADVPAFYHVEASEPCQIVYTVGPNSRLLNVDVVWKSDNRSNNDLAVIWIRALDNLTSLKFPASCAESEVVVVSTFTFPKKPWYRERIADPRGSHDVGSIAPPVIKTPAEAKPHQGLVPDAVPQGY